LELRVGMNMEFLDMSMGHTLTIAMYLDTHCKQHRNPLAVFNVAFKDTPVYTCFGDEPKSSAFDIFSTQSKFNSISPQPAN